MKSIVTLFSEKLNFSVVFNFDIKNEDSQVNAVLSEKLNLETELIYKTELSLKRSLKHLEFVSYIESCKLDKDSKYFHENFLSEMESSKYEARVNTIRASRDMLCDAA